VGVFGIALIAMPVGLFTAADLELSQVLPQGVADERRPVDLEASGDSVDTPKQFRFHHHLYRLHMWILIHNRLHSQTGP